ncbi:hypothetical protein PENFLA_c040G09588 [Penicillium flavigenum]|uniref:Translationally-controlled tumor protein homolog n=1 Tax=Penicillium flavigenum TaxID=254877 RepID=A0A1V6SJN8_9EURO|nr:hypothetical protein PENFLA_c040G09588 [Penicillium flavigenum]
MVSLFTDVITGDDMFSSAFLMKQVDNIVYEVDCQMVTVKKAATTDFDADDSTEEEGVKVVNNVVETFGLQETTFNKASYLSNFKGYIKRIHDHLEVNAPDQVEEFQKNVNLYIKKIVSRFKDYEFYTGSSMNAEGMIALLGYRPDGIQPYFTFWKHGLNATELKE